MQPFDASEPDRVRRSHAPTRRRDRALSPAAWAAAAPCWHMVRHGMGRATTGGLVRDSGRTRHELIELAQ